MGETDFRPGFVGQSNRFLLAQDSNVPTMNLTTTHFKTIKHLGT